ncbi:putative development/cell death domain, kelch-type beta propeller containing protein [Tanacetum coccineum]|uniref:Development/cell death domain, kelch-type beta propeller containing protein n=1 Tax=Tanacetum coccineum TaxID=301880 RepID=A0ABQ5I6T5_9ASTR
MITNRLKLVYIVGGFDGSSSLESYSPFKDTKSSLNSMQFVKKYASAAVLNGELYHFGGEGFHTVESFIPSQNQWVPRPPLFWKNIHVAGASVKDRLFVVGGAKGRQCSSEVEYLDLDIGKWIPTCPMLSKRFSSRQMVRNETMHFMFRVDTMELPI